MPLRLLWDPIIVLLLLWYQRFNLPLFLSCLRSFFTQSGLLLPYLRMVLSPNLLKCLIVPLFFGFVKTSCHCPRAGWSISEIFGAHQLNIELGQSHWNPNGMTSRAFGQLLIHLYQSSKARTQGITFPSSCDLIKNLPTRCATLFFSNWISWFGSDGRKKDFGNGH